MEGGYSPNHGFLDFCPLKKYNLATRTRSSPERLTSNPMGCLYTAFTGVYSVLPLDGVNSKLSTQSIISILSTLVAPRLHQKPT
jgi:hypothetical protein